MTDSFPSPGFRPLIHRYTGELKAGCRPTRRGFDSDVTVLVECEKGSFFVKAMRNRPGGRRDSIIREGLINPYVRDVSPAVRWRAEDEDWVVLGFEAVDGRPADFAPGSADLPAVVGAVDRLGGLDVPEVARGWVETRWDRFAADPGEAELFRGDALLHTDINPGNLHVGAERVWVVDWAWPTRGAAFIDPAMLAVQLVSAGHSAESAESWASRCRAWRETDPKALDAFAAATVRMNRAFAARKPDAAWLGAMVAAAEAWAVHRGVRVG